MPAGKIKKNGFRYTLTILILCLYFFIYWATPGQALAQRIAPLIFENGFEDNILPPGVSIYTVGNFTSAAPGIKETTHFGSTRAFGFGKTDCTANCWNDATTTLRIELPGNIDIALITFDEAELEGNWGSTGYVYVDGNLVNDGIFERLPWNDLTADSFFRHRALNVNLTGHVIEFKVIDITSSSEMFIDNIAIFAYGPVTNVSFCNVSFDSPDLPPGIHIETKGTFIVEPGFRIPAIFNGSQSFGFGKSTSHINAYDDYATSLTFDLNVPFRVQCVVFSEAELDTNWGGQGKVYIDDREVPYSTFGRLPSNDKQADTSFRTHFIPINQVGQRVTLKVTDITDIGEIVIDQLYIILTMAGGPPIFSEDFEDNALEPEMSVQSLGQFISAPGIKEIDKLGGSRAFGFGKSDCGSDCYHSNQSSLTIFYPKGVELKALKFEAMEIDNNWGSQGELYINGQMWPSMDFARQPSNDLTADTTFRSYYCYLNIRVYEIKWTVWDITNESEMFIDGIELLASEPDAVDGRDLQPDQFRMLQNYPNPFNSSTTISFSLTEASPVQVTIFNSQGQIVEKRDLGRKDVGVHQVVWDAEKFSSGAYFCRIQTLDATEVLKLVLIR